MSLIDLRLKMIWCSVDEQSGQVKISEIIGGPLAHPSTAWIEDRAAPNAMRFLWHSPGLLCSLALQYELDRPVKMVRVSDQKL
jgi:hypothetical protein